MNKYKQQILQKQTRTRQQNFEKMILGCQKTIKTLKEQKKRLQEEIKVEEEIKIKVQRRLNAFYGVDKNFNIPTDVINAEQKEIKESEDKEDSTPELC